MKQLSIFLLAFLIFNPLMFSQCVGKHEKVAESESLKLGEEIVVDDFSVKFLNLLSDSRCPVSVTCIWEGEAEIVLGINFNQNYFEKKVIVTGRASEILKIGDFQISLQYLDPYPVTPKKIGPEEYSLGLRLITAP